MQTRRSFLEQSLRGSSLIALSAAAPNFLAASAAAAEPGKDTILVVLEMTGGNDGLNTVVPYRDDDYRAARPTLRITQDQVVRIDDELGLNPGLRSFAALLEKGQLAVAQGVGYPNPNRSHFESMDVWQSGDPVRAAGQGWLGRSLNLLESGPGHIPGIHVGSQQLPLAMQGAAMKAPTVHRGKPYDLQLSRQPGASRYGGGYYASTPQDAEAQFAERRRLIEELAELAPAGNNLLQFVQRSEVQTYASVKRLKEITAADPRASGYARPYGYRGGGELQQNLNLIAHMISAELGARIFYVSFGGFDTHANQLATHQQLLQQLADGITSFFTQLETAGHAGRVLLMTFSEFGRRVQENGSRGTDHGAGSCLFVAGPAVKGGVHGEHPRLDALDAGDLKHHTDFRQVYATLLDQWLECPSQQVLAGKFEHLPLLKRGRDALDAGNRST